MRCAITKGFFRELEPCLLGSLVNERGATDSGVNYMFFFYSYFRENYLLLNKTTSRAIPINTRRNYLDKDLVLFLTEFYRVTSI